MYVCVFLWYFFQDVRWAKYDEAYADSCKLIDETSAALVELDQMVYSADYCTEGGLSYDRDSTHIARERVCECVCARVCECSYGLV